MKKSKKILLASILILLVCIIFLIRGNRSHLDEEHAQFYVNLITSDMYVIEASDTIIDRKIALSIANKLLSKKTGKWNSFFYKPFDIYLINDYWFIHCTVPKNMTDYGPMLLINCKTGEIKFWGRIW